MNLNGIAAIERFELWKRNKNKYAPLNQLETIFTMLTFQGTREPESPKYRTNIIKSLLHCPPLFDPALLKYKMSLSQSAVNQTGGDGANKFP